jgi:ATP-binding cassette subfamily A (ABC1) protein 3
MEEADALATYAGIVGTRLFALGTTGFLRKKHGNVYHLHLMHKSAPTSTTEEMQRVEG